MNTKQVMYLLALVAAGLGLYWAASPRKLDAQSATAVRIDSDDIGGVVTSSKGPEAGVWVIAETTDLPTRLSKTVVTDDQGRYVIPDLPKANYNVWVRGYGLVDSKKVQAAPGKAVNLTAEVAPDDRAAAQYYPASYWYSLLKVPEKSEFPGTGPKGNGISPNMKSQAQMIEMLKTDSCWSCHALGTKATREISKGLGNFDSPSAAWERRIQSGQAGGQMLGSISSMGKERALAMFGDWTTRIAAGELPPKPPRPQGIERNVVVTQWDWSKPTAYLHDEIASDKRDPSVNANGLIYGAPELSTDDIPVLDPVHNTTTSVKMPVRDPQTPRPGPPLKPSVFWGEESIWDSQANMHNPMFDEKGRVWFTSVIRPSENPAYCKDGSVNSSAKLFPVARSGRQLAFYDPKSKQFTLIDTCFSTHHLQFDKNGILWTSSGGGGDVVGWLDVKKFEETHDEQRSQGWTALVLDTNGNGKRDDYVEPNDPVNPAKDKRISGSFYGLTVSPSDGTIWGTILGFPGRIVRLNPGTHPPETALAEVYELPWGNPNAKVQGYSPRGLDIDTSGVVWTVLSSGHFASFDRRKCKGPLNGPAATGQHCPEGWSLYAFPVPNLKGVTDSGSAEASYYDWVDQFDTFGLGKNTPIATGNGEDGLMALVNGKWVTLRVPYPVGYFAKGLDGRIDDPKTGWKGKGLWSTYGTRTMFHTETGKGTMAKVLHFQLRPDPLAN
jgi:hypothetical protein